MNKLNKVKNYLICPYSVGKNKTSLAMVLPSQVVKSLKIDPLSIFLLLRVKGNDELELKIIREEDLAKKEEMSSSLSSTIEKFPRLPMQTTTTSSSTQVRELAN